MIIYTIYSLLFILFFHSILFFMPLDVSSGSGHEHSPVASPGLATVLYSVSCSCSCPWT